MTHRTTPPPQGRSGAPLQAAPVELDPLAARAVTELCHSDLEIHCGLTVTRRRRLPETVATSSDLPIRIDWLQQQLGQGPDLTPVGSDLVVARDLAADQRWTDFGRMCTAVFGLRSMVSVHAHSPGLLVTLKFFSPEPSAFDHVDVDAALRVVRRALPSARAELDRFPPAGDDAAPRAHCSTMALALGIVTAQFRLGPADGYALLARAAAHDRRTLHELAVDVATGGRLPGLGGAPRVSRQAGEHPAAGGFAARAEHVGGPDLWRELPPTTPREPVSTASPVRSGSGAGGFGLWSRVDAAGVA